MTIVNFDAVVASIFVTVGGAVEITLPEIYAVRDSFNKEYPDVHFELTQAHINWVVKNSEGNIKLKGNTITTSDNAAYFTKRTYKDLVDWLNKNQ